MASAAQVRGVAVEPPSESWRILDWREQVEALEFDSIAVRKQISEEQFIQEHSRMAEPNIP